jgi:hypothetical protein
MLGRFTFGEENDVCFNALTVGSKGTSGQTKDCVYIAKIGQPAGLIKFLEFARILLQA